MTTADTLHVVSSIGYNKNPGENLTPWSHFTEAYLADYVAHAARNKPIANNISLAQFSAWQKSLVDVERASVERVEGARIFANVTRQDVEIEARQALQERRVIMRPGLICLLNHLYARGSHIAIISLNWSSTFIDACLHNTLDLSSSCTRGRGITVNANEIQFGPTGRLSRKFQPEDRGIWTADDKARVMQIQLKTASTGRSSVYVGDSTSDLLCLLLADVGICVKDDEPSSEQQDLQHTLARLNISCSWIGEYTADTCKDSGKRVWWARNFHDICHSTLVEGFSI